MTTILNILNFSSWTERELLLNQLKTCLVIRWAIEGQIGPLVLIFTSWEHHINVGWLGEANLSCSSRHWGFQLRLAYSWARPAILVAREGRGGGGMFLFLLFIHLDSFFSFSHAPHLFYLFSQMTQNDPQELMLTPTRSIKAPYK